jgi:hypothetical protein
MVLKRQAQLINSQMCTTHLSSCTYDDTSRSSWHISDVFFFFFFFNHEGQSCIFICGEITFLDPPDGLGSMYGLLRWVVGVVDSPQVGADAHTTRATRRLSGGSASVAKFGAKRVYHQQLRARRAHTHSRTRSNCNMPNDQQMPKSPNAKQCGN